jgi:hypothetical protein
MQHWRIQLRWVGQLAGTMNWVQVGLPGYIKSNIYYLRIQAIACE